MDIKKELESIKPFLSSHPPFHKFVKCFAPFLPQIAEISVNPHDESVGVMTGGKGDQFLIRTHKYLMEEGLNDEIDTFEEATRYFSPAFNTLIKRDFSPIKAREYSIYWQEKIPISHILKITQEIGISHRGFDFIKELSRKTKQEKAFLGIGFSEGKVGAKILLSIPINKFPQHTPYIAQKIDEIANSKKIFQQIHNIIVEKSHGSIFISIPLGKEIPSSIKIDYEIVPIETATSIMQILNVDKSFIGYSKRILEKMQMNNITYIGIKYTPQTSPLIKIYFDLRYSRKREYEKQILVDFLTNTQWEIR